MSRLSDLDECIAATEEKLKSLKAEREAVREQEKGSLFRRWATHPEHGRGVIVSVYPYEDNTVKFCHLDGDFACGSAYAYVHLADLTFDPVTLTAAADFENAPNGTIIEAVTKPYGVYKKVLDFWYSTGSEEVTLFKEMPTSRVIRWGTGK